MNPIMRAAVEECLDTFGRTGDPQVIDLIMDRACFRHIKVAAEASDVGFLKDFAGIMIDLANIRIFLRIKSMKKGRDFLQKFLLPGGSLDGKLFLENLEEPVDSFANSLKYGPYASLEEGFESYKATGSITKLEKLSDNFVMSFVKKARYTAFGAEPLVGYLMAKEHEIKNIRIIMVGKINNISNDLIKERLRETYV
jgi:V/A-type H+-transporting ATPase subunit C